MQDPLSLVSTGTGILQLKPVPSRTVEMVQHLVSLATQTEMAAERLAPEHRDMIAQDVYLRLNVQHGSDYIGSDQWQSFEPLQAATYTTMLE